MAIIDKTAAAVAKKEAALRGDDDDSLDNNMRMGVDGAGGTKLKPRRAIKELFSRRTPVTPPLSPEPSLHDGSDGEESLSGSSSPTQLQLQQRQMDEDEEETKRYNRYVVVFPPFLPPSLPSSLSSFLPL